MRQALSALGILGALFLSAAPSADAGHLSLEGGFTLSGNFPTGTGRDPAYGAIGFAGQVSYENRDWGLGVRGLGMVSPDTAFHVQANGYNLRGELARRQYGIGIFGRYFFLGSMDRKIWYLELGFMGVQTDFIHADTVYVLPESQNYTRLFLRGGAFTLGAGYRPRQGPFFFQLLYELSHYETLEVVGDVKYLHPILAEPALDHNYFISSVIALVGLDVFGR